VEIKLHFSVSLLCPRPHRSEALSDDACLTSVYLSCTSGLSREQRGHRKTKIGIEVAHVTRDSDTTFKVKRLKVKVTGDGGVLWRPPAQLFSFCRHLTLMSVLSLTCVDMWGEVDFYATLLNIHLLGYVPNWWKSVSVFWRYSFKKLIGLLFFWTRCVIRDCRYRGSVLWWIGLRS